MSQLLTEIREFQNKVNLEPCRAAILDCRVIHKMVRVFQETFVNDDLYKKDDPATTQRICIILSGMRPGTTLLARKRERLK